MRLDERSNESKDGDDESGVVRSACPGRNPRECSLDVSNHSRCLPIETAWNKLDDRPQQVEALLFGGNGFVGCLLQRCLGKRGGLAGQGAGTVSQSSLSVFDRYHCVFLHRAYSRERILIRQAVQPLPLQSRRRLASADTVGTAIQAGLLEQSFPRGEDLHPDRLFPFAQTGRK